MKEKEQEIAHGKGCTWWDAADKARTKETAMEANTPCCPHCKGLVANTTLNRWNKIIEMHANITGNRRYKEFMAWIRGRCFATYNAAWSQFLRERPEDGGK